MKKTQKMLSQYSTELRGLLDLRPTSLASLDGLEQIVETDEEPRPVLVAIDCCWWPTRLGESPADSEG
jgi:hypothetical protein